jgi:SNF2 family DNA or RNA helicase
MGEKADPGSVALPMSSDQLVAYGKAITQYREAKNLVGQERSNSMLQLLQKLRMICAYPMAELRPDHEQVPIADHLRLSPKLAWLVERLEGIARKNEKAIVFTDYRVLQRLIQRAVQERFGIRPSVVNGSTSANATSESSRQKLIDAFQQSDGFGVIILGTTAVGFGVNIQRANHVIHFTRSWNPAKEDQATDRAYRIGQTRDVYVYCPTVAGQGFASFEQRLAERLDYKRALSSDMLAGPQELTMADFEDL